jgi:homotetrameric cytidine deaminase
MWPVNTLVSRLRNIRTDISSLIYYTLVLLAVSIPLSEFGMSISQFLLLLFWVIEGSDFVTLRKKQESLSGLNRFTELLRTIGLNLAGKFRHVFHNPALLAVISLYLIHAAGILYSSDIDYALKDLRIKLPLLSLPVLLATTAPLSNQRFRTLLIFFIMAVFSGTLVSMFVLITRHVSDPRELSIFISHIRFGLTICFSLFILIHFLFKRVFIKPAGRILTVFGIIWFLLFLLILESVTGLAITLTLFFILTLFAVLKIKKKLVKLAVLILLLLSPVAVISYFIEEAKQFSEVEKVDFSKLDKYTDRGTPYIHDTSSYGIENGKYVGLYLATAELRQAWNSRSEMSYDGTDKKGQKLSYTLIRFLSSKGLRKDAGGMSQLTQKEISYIENGVANVAYLENLSLKSRFDQMLMGYSNYVLHGDPNASSVIQRIEYWKTSTYILKHHWLTGVGTGDLNVAFSAAYEEMGSKLSNAFRNRSHNQFLAIFIAFGVGGLLIFLFSLFYPPLKTGWYRDYYYIVFFIILFMSMLTEDTLETQAGATFFAFFNALLLFGRKRNGGQPTPSATTDAGLNKSLPLETESKLAKMRSKELTIRYFEADNPSELDQADKQLLEKASLAAVKAYAPYSGFRVGAALRLDNGTIVSGNNQENAAYPSGLCAERVALFSASSQYPGEIIDSIAITVNTDKHTVIEPVPPCGACRQVLAEYEKKQGHKIRIIFSGESGKTIIVDSIDSLLPISFNSNNLQHK